LLKKLFLLIAIIAMFLLVFSGAYYIINNLAPAQEMPDGKGLIPVEISLENDLTNITLAIGSTVSINITLTSNLSTEITVVINHFLQSFDYVPDWFDVSIYPQQLILAPYSRASTILTIHLTKDTPLDFQPVKLVLEMESEQYPSVRFWDRSIEIHFQLR
jgi:hypothetical protein